MKKMNNYNANNNYKINDKIFTRLNEIDVEKLSKKIDDNRPKQILSVFPENQTLTDKEAIKYIKSKTGLDDNTIIHSFNSLLENKKLISVYDRKNELHLTKSLKIINL